MKKEKYKVIYLNGNEEAFFCNGFREAIILAKTHAINMAWDMRLKYIIDENGMQIENIEVPSFQYSKRHPIREQSMK